MLSWLYEALASPFGKVVKIQDGTVEQLRQKLYRERRDANDPNLATLALVPSPTAEDELWIVKKNGQTQES